MKKYILYLIAMVFMASFTTATCFAQPAGFEKAASGLSYKLFTVGQDTAKPKTGDRISLTMLYTGKLNGKDTIFFNSQDQMKGMPMQFQLPASSYPGDIYDGIKMMTNGDSAVFLIVADSLYLKTFNMKELPAGIAPNTIFSFHLNLLSFDSPESLIRIEQEMLKRYLEENKITDPPLASGIYILESVPGQGISVDTGSMVKMHLVVSFLDGKQLFSSYQKGDPFEFQYGQKFDTPGLQEAVGKLKKGSKARVIVPSQMAFGDQGRGTLIPPYTALVYELEMVDVKSKNEYQKEIALKQQQDNLKKDSIKMNEATRLHKYLKDNAITTPALLSGLYYIESLKGTGELAKSGDTVTVHYTGTLIDGTKFDSSRDRNEPFSFTLGRRQVISGWDQGISLMRKGGKATLIIPSSLGYGERDMQVIPPYSTLVFEVELLDIK